MASGEASLRRIRADHLKKKADQALQEGNHRLAWQTYTEAIEAKPDRDGLWFLYGNRSLAYARSHRFHDALSDAETATDLAPKWGKAHWRRGAALLGLGDVPAAINAYLHAWELQGRTTECHNKLWQVVQRLTREQLAERFLQELKRLQNAGTIVGMDIESAGVVATNEAAFRVIYDAHRDCPKPGPYYATLLRWITMKGGVKPSEAYTVRAAINLRAKCYLQARQDALSAIKALEKEMETLGAVDSSDGNSAEKDPFTGRDATIALLGTAYLRLGNAYMAEPDHPDRDPIGAFKALTAATKFGADTQEARDRLHEASELLTKEQIERAALGVYNEGSLPNDFTSITAPLRPGERRFRVEVRLAFPKAKPADMKAGVREKIRRALADVACVGPACVTLEGLLPARPPDRNAMEVVLRVEVGPRLLQGKALVKAIDSSNYEDSIVGGADVVAALGPVDLVASRADIVDVTPRQQIGETEAIGASEVDVESKQLAVPAAPKAELEVPYKMYRLVTAGGLAVERVDKHPFCMSRVYYDAAEKPEEVWVELADGSCRWRQTAGEIRILALKVPPDLSARNLHVEFAPYHVFVRNKVTNETYLEGQLHRGVIPEDCFWTHCGGVGEDGCCLTLRKMNLEVLSKQWAHSESWWPRLFEHHGDIAWDDYEKDYSDLPEEVMAKHRKVEAIKDAEKRIEDKERTRREALQEADDLRKRRRQERLHQLRSGETTDWVRLHRGFT